MLAYGPRDDRRRNSSPKRPSSRLQKHLSQRLEVRLRVRTSSLPLRWARESPVFGSPAGNRQSGWERLVERCPNRGPRDAACGTLLLRSACSARPSRRRSVQHAAARGPPAATGGPMPLEGKGTIYMPAPAPGNLWSSAHAGSLSLPAMASPSGCPPERRRSRSGARRREAVTARRRPDHEDEALAAPREVLDPQVVTHALDASGRGRGR